MRCRSPTPSTTMPQPASATSTPDVSRPSRRLATSSKRYPPLASPRSITAERSSHDPRPSQRSDAAVVISIHPESRSSDAQSDGASSDGSSSTSALSQLEYGLTDDSDDGGGKVSDDESLSSSSAAGTAKSSFPSVASPITSSCNNGVNRSIATSCVSHLLHSS